MATLTPERQALLEGWLTQAEEQLQRLMMGEMESRFSHTNEQSTRDITFRQDRNQESMLRRRIDEIKRELGLTVSRRYPIVVCN